MKPKIIISEKNGDIRWTSSNEETIDFILKNVIPLDANYVFMYDDSQIDYSFNFCYDFNFNDENGSTAIPFLNLEKAKELFLNYVRYKRSELFPDLDLQYMRVLETGNQTLIQEIVTKKQELRDLTNIDFSDVTNSVQIREKWPTEILGQIPF
jgi:hypothetical protein